MYGSEEMYLSKKSNGKRKWSKARLEIRKKKMLEKMKEYQEKENKDANS